MSLSSIRRQVEYYFNDFNLMRDQFLKNEIKLSKEAGKDGFVSLDIMLKFNKLAQLTTDKEKIVSAINESPLIQLNDDKNGIRRNPERKLPIDDEIYRAGLKARTCYVEGFPRDTSGEHKEAKQDAEAEGAAEKSENAGENAETLKKEKYPTSKTNVSLDQIYDFFDAHKFQVETIAMRRLKNTKVEKLKNRFTGSIFITFISQSEAEKFLNSDFEFVHDETNFKLTKMTKAMYWSMQNAKNDAAKKGGNVEAAVEAARKAAENKEVKPIKFEEGIAVKFSGVTDATIRREDIKEFIVENEGAVEYVSFESGKDSGLILLNLEHGKKGGDVLKGDSTSKNIKGNELKFELASEKEFDTIHTEFLAFKKKMDLLKGQNGKFKKGKKNKRGGYKGKVVDRNAEDNQEKEAKNTRKRFADSDDEGAEAKVAKNE